MGGGDQFGQRPMGPPDPLWETLPASGHCTQQPTCFPQLVHFLGTGSPALPGTRSLLPRVT